VIQTNVADKAQLVGLFGKSGDCEVVVELVTVPGDFFGLWAYSQIDLNHSLVLVIPWTKHHSMFTECDTPLIPVVRKMRDRKNRHDQLDQSLIMVLLRYRVRPDSLSFEAMHGIHCFCATA
jgi:hypothetical protein